MNLLLDETPVLETTGDPSQVEVRGIAYDSRRVAAGDLFCCVPGRESDGHAHAPEAVSRGAVGLLCERLLPEGPASSVPQARVAPGTVRAAMAAVAAAFYGFPARALVMAGVTGTNGKTTVTALLAAALEAAGHPATVVGTLTGRRTTPESVDLQRQLREVADTATPGRPLPAVALEVSSHALVQSRVDAVHFDVVAFTNLGHDHLDFHGTMEEYGRAKASLFDPERAVRGVVNGDDEWGRRILREARIPLVAVHGDDASDVSLEPGRTAFTWRGQRVTLALTGAFNVTNGLVAAESAVALGLEPEVVARGLSGAGGVPGRMEIVASPRGGPAVPAAPFTVVVDYAHTPDALRAVLDAARQLAGDGGRVLTVFGCGGDRDRAKRPLMGAVVAERADRSFVTSDNPRHEDPAAIIAEVVAGMPGGAAVVEPDRRTAIEMAVGEAAPGDVVVVAGKGHEAYQETGDERRPFDDRAVAAGAVAARAGS